MLSAVGIMVLGLVNSQTLPTQKALDTRELERLIRKVDLRLEAQASISGTELSVRYLLVNSSPLAKVVIDSTKQIRLSAFDGTGKRLRTNWDDLIVDLPPARQVYATLYPGSIYGQDLKLRVTDGASVKHITLTVAVAGRTLTAQRVLVSRAEK